MDRIISIRNGAVAEVVAGADGTRIAGVEGQRGDPILRAQMAALVERDCARRLLLTPLLAALADEDRRALVDYVRGWDDPGLRDAALEMLGVVNTTTRPRARHMTLAQFEALVSCFVSAEPWHVSYPMTSGGDCRVVGPEGTRQYVKSSGRVIEP